MINIRNYAVGIIAALSLAACSCPEQQPATLQTCDKGKAIVETIMSRRSIRKYKAQPVGRDTVETIVRCGINAPSGMNRQPWEIRIVDDKASIDSITAICRRLDPRMGQDTTMVTMFRNAYTVVFVAAQNGAALDCGILGENMVIAAWGMGIGSCFLGGPIHFLKNTPEAKPFLDKLDFSEGSELVYALALGYPDETPDAKPRDESKFKFVD